MTATSEHIRAERHHVPQRPAGRTPAGAMRTSWIDRTGSSTGPGGDLGVLPVIGGLIVIWAVFQAAQPDLPLQREPREPAMECVPVGMISLGIVCILLVGEIDLSVGSVARSVGRNAGHHLRPQWPAGRCRRRRASLAEAL